MIYTRRSQVSHDLLARPFSFLYVLYPINPRIFVLEFPKALNHFFKLKLSNR